MQQMTTTYVSILHIIQANKLHKAPAQCPTSKALSKVNSNKLGDTIAISNLKLSITHWPTDRGKC